MTIRKWAPGTTRCFVLDIETGKDEEFCQHGDVQSVGDRRMEASEVGGLVHASIAGTPDPAPVYGAR